MDDAFLSRLGINEKNSVVHKGNFVYRETVPIRSNEEQPRQFKSEVPRIEEDFTFGIRTGEPKPTQIIQAFSDKRGIILNGIEVSPDIPPIIRAESDMDIPRVSPMKLELLYANEGMIHNWINRLVEYFLSAEPKIVCTDKEDQLAMDKWAIKTNFRELLKLHFQHKYVYGNAIWRWSESENGKKDKIDFIDPKYFDALRDNQGKVQLDDKGLPIAYVQYIKFGQQVNVSEDRKITQQAPFEYQSGQGIKFTPDEVIHFRLNRLGDSWWGIGQIEPTYGFALNKKNADLGYAESLQRVGYPRIVSAVGDENHPPTLQQIDDVWRELSGIHEKNQLVVPYYVKFYMLESKKSNLKENLGYFNDGIVAGLGGPKPLITGLGEDTNRATLNDQKMWLERSLKMEQKDTGDDITRRVLMPVAEALGLKSIPRLVWQEVSMESHESKVSRIVDLVKAGVLVANDPKLRAYIADLEDIPITLNSDVAEVPPRTVPEDDSSAEKPIDEKVEEEK